MELSHNRYLLGHFASIASFERTLALQENRFDVQRITSVVTVFAAAASSHYLVIFTLAIAYY
jgi:hypothetical protein